METSTTSIKELYERGENFYKTSIELAQLKGLETTTLVVSSLIWRLSVILVLSLFVIILSIGIALLLSDFFGKTYFGFFIVAGFYLLAGILLHFFLRNWIEKSMSKLILSQVNQ